MLDLKAKLLAAGLVTVDQVKKVEDQQAEKQRRLDERQQAELQRRGDRGDRPAGRGDRGPRSDGPRGPRGPGAPGGGPRRDRPAREERPQLSDAERAAQDQARWEKRLQDLKAGGKSDQYDAIRGWVLRARIDERNAVLTEGAQRFYFAKADNSIGHITLEPAVHAQVAAGDAGITAFMGFNGLEHAVVPAALARDIHVVKPEWVRHLLGLTDVAVDQVEPPEGSVDEGVTPVRDAPTAAETAALNDDAPSDAAASSDAPPSDAAPSEGSAAATEDAAPPAADDDETR